MKGLIAVTTKAIPRAQRNCRASSMGFALRHLVIGPTPIKNNAGAIRGTKTALK